MYSYLLYQETKTTGVATLMVIPKIDEVLARLRSLK